MSRGPTRPLLSAWWKSRADRFRRGPSPSPSGRRAGERIHVCAGSRRAADLQRASRGLAPDREVTLFHAWDCLPYDRASPTPGVMGERMAALHGFAQRQTSPRLVVTTPLALLQRILPAGF
jgi:transcription-repair coupling factor (superfamily II helicase)